MSGILDLSDPGSGDAGADVVSGVINVLNANIATGVPTPGSFVAINVADADTITIQLTGTWVGTLAAYGSLDNLNRVALTNAINVNGGASVSAFNSTASNGIYQLDVAGISYIYIFCTAYTSGSVNVTLSPTDNTGVVGLDTPLVLGASAAAIGTVATPNGSAISVVTAASTNASVQKASAGSLFELTISNPTATAAYVKLYNKASAPTVGTDIPVLTIPVPATAAGVGTISLPFGNIGKRFTTGIAMAVTAAAVATDTGVTVAGIQIHGTYI